MCNMLVVPPRFKMNLNENCKVTGLYAYLSSAPSFDEKLKTIVNYLLITGTKSSECSEKSNSTSFTVKETARRTHAINCERGDAAKGICITSFQPLQRHSALLKIPARFLHFPRTSGRNLSIHALHKIQN